MRVALIGWYDHQNAGDDRMNYCLTRFFTEKGCEVTTYDCGCKRLDYEMLNTHDYVLFGGGSFHIRQLRKFGLKQITTRLAFVGLGVEGIYGEGNFLDWMIKKADFILLRDQRSCQRLRAHNAISGHDLTFLYPYAEAAEARGPIVCGLNLRYWTLFNLPEKYDHFLFRRLYKRTEKWRRCLGKIGYSGGYNPRVILKTVYKHFQEIRFIPLYTDMTDVRYKDNKVAEKLGLSASHDFESKKMRSLSYMVSMRLHGLIFATQMGLPFVGISYQHKCLDFLDQIGLSELGIECDHLSGLQYKLLYMRKHQAHIRRKLLEYRQRAHQETHEIMKKIYVLMSRRVDS